MVDSETKAMVRRTAYVKSLISHAFKRITSIEHEQHNKSLLKELIHKTDANLLIVEEFDASISESELDAELDSLVQIARDIILRWKKLWLN